MMVNCQFAHERAEEVGGGLVHKLLFCDARGRYIHRMQCRNCDQNRDSRVDRAWTNTDPDDFHTHTNVKGPHILDYPKCLEEKANQWFDKEVLKK
jgi:hypothetical protein